eukprot:GFUD01136744.1.p1 GENE.GFUD01136744.1~~GFUD01136744.1.p1  ORF type:complete len:199 (+),score=28.86 GFUD01136744.1:155-751(+)
MGSFTRMKEDVEELTMQLSAKLPGKRIIWVFLAVVVLIVFILGFGIGFASTSSNPCSGSSCQVPVYLFISNNSESCPALTGERLLTTVADGQSFEGLSVLLQCQGSYLPFPTSVRCTRKKLFDGALVLEWSNLPVCYPSNLISLEYWKETIHARGFSLLMKMTDLLSSSEDDLEISKADLERILQYLESQLRNKTGLK